MSDSGWHLDKKVPIAFILTIILQTSVFIWWAATTNARLEQMDVLNADQSVDIDMLNDSYSILASMNEKLIRIDIAVQSGILPRADERIKNLELRMENLEQ